MKLDILDILMKGYIKGQVIDDGKRNLIGST